MTLHPKDVKQAATAVAEASPALAALALDVLSRQGEGRVLFAGREFVDARAKHHGVNEDAAKLGAVDVLGLLREGPSDARGFATLAALAVRGLKAHLDDEARLARFVRHADWLELSTPYAPYGFVAPVLGDDADAVWEAVRKATAALGDSPKDRAHRALHEATLASTGKPAPVATSSELQVEGDLRHPPRGGFLGALRLATGLALLQWLGRGAAFLLGVRRRAVLSFHGGGLRLRKRVTLLGRVVRERDESFTLAAVASAARCAKRPALGLLVGALTFALGILAGGLFFVEGVRSGETFLLLFGAGLIAAGAALDLGLSVLLPAHRTRRALELAVLPKRRFGLLGDDESNIERFVDELERRLPSR
ncbi:MAG: hypothetical protein H6724_04300 [Sandaracinus sp.]|nr:hypothetical protein [Myxococcales bacterium]MCB9618659.1 hypothetical protein [Sandaracinus sp.]